MSSFKTLLEAFLSESEDNAKHETITTHATRLMKTGKYDPTVRGAAAQFKRDLIATGITDSPTSANFAWKNHKHLHPGLSDAQKTELSKSSLEKASDRYKEKSQQKIYNTRIGRWENGHGESIPNPEKENQSYGMKVQTHPPSKYM